MGKDDCVSANRDSKVGGDDNVISADSDCKVTSHLVARF
jgi:hypothetical protein